MKNLLFSLLAVVLCFAQLNSAMAFSVGYTGATCWVEGFKCSSGTSQFRDYSCGSVDSLVSAINELTKLGCSSINQGSGGRGDQVSPQSNSFVTTEVGDGRCLMSGSGCTSGGANQSIYYPCGDTAQALNVINSLRDNGCTSIRSDGTKSAVEMGPNAGADFSFETAKPAIK